MASKYLLDQDSKDYQSLNKHPPGGDERVELPTWEAGVARETTGRGQRARQTGGGRRARRRRGEESGPQSPGRGECATAGQQTVSRARPHEAHEERRRRTRANGDPAQPPHQVRKGRCRSGAARVVWSAERVVRPASDSRTRSTGK